MHEHNILISSEFFLLLYPHLHLLQGKDTLKLAMERHTGKNPGGFQMEVFIVLKMHYSPVIITLLFHLYQSLLMNSIHLHFILYYSKKLIYTHENYTDAMCSNNSTQIKR